MPNVKKKINELLSQLDQKVIIFIDDIDRLERDFMRMLLRMIRLNADFSNVTYVLAFDRFVVERNLDEENGIRGRDYLEKIIQTSFEIPKPEPQTIHDIFGAKMAVVLTSIKTTRPLDRHRWGNVFHSGFKEHFKTIRNINRYMNGLWLTLTPVAEEVDLVDFLVIELIRVFHPEVYLGVAQSKDMLMPEIQGLQNEMSLERLNKWIEDLCAKASPEFQNSIRQILDVLFQGVVRTTHNSDYYIMLRKDCRICSPDVFDRFFLLAISTGDISELEIAAFIEELADADKTAATIQQALKTGKARRLLERLEDFTDELPVEHVKPLLKVMFDLGDTLRFNRMHMLDINADELVPRIIFQSLERLESEDIQYELLLESVIEGASLYTAVQQTSLSEPKKESHSYQISDRDHWEILRNAALDKITAAKDSGELWNLDKLKYVLFQWLNWTSEKEVRKEIDAYIENDDKLIDFIERLISEDYIPEKIARKIDKQNLKPFIDLDAAKTRLENLNSEDDETDFRVKKLIIMIEPKDGS